MTGLSQQSFPGLLDLELGEELHLQGTELERCGRGYWHLLNPSPWGRRVGLSGKGGKAEVGRGTWPREEGACPLVPQVPFLTLRGSMSVPRAGMEWAGLCCDSHLCGSRYRGPFCVLCSM